MLRLAVVKIKYTSDNLVYIYIRNDKLLHTKYASKRRSVKHILINYINKKKIYSKSHDYLLRVS